MMSGLPRRDAWLLPLISILTVLGMLAGGEVCARVVWPEQRQDTCMIQNSALGYRYRPNCSSTMKLVEGPWYTSRYNACGYRSDAPCGPAPAGTRRIALIGASVSGGYGVEYSDTIGARLGADLTAMCGGPVELQNLAAGTGAHQARRLVLRMEEALTMQPSAVLLIQVPFDVKELGDDATVPITSVAQPVANANPPAVPKAELRHRVNEWLKESRAVTVAQHLLFRDVSIYLPLFLHHGDEADYLRPPFTVAWQERLRRFDVLITALANLSRQAGVPFMLAFVPQRAELLLMSDRFAPPGVDPQALPNAMANIAARRGVTFVDTSQVLRAEPKPDQLYYRVDGHPSGPGHKIIARYIAQRYISTANGPFADCRSTTVLP